MIRKRRRGLAIVETSKGILVVAGSSRKFILPGGGAERGESREKAAVRELYEETGLKTNKIKYLFFHMGHVWHDKKGKRVRNYSKVFLVKSEGKPKPCNEIKYIAFWKEGSKICLSKGSREVISKYLENKS